MNVYLSEPQLRQALGVIISVYIQVLTFLMRRIRWKACGLPRQGAPELKLAVAGGINLQTLPRIIAAKPDLIIVGGAICKAVDPIETAKTMKKMILEEAIQ